MIYALLDHPAFATADLSSLQTVFYGASPMSPVRLQEAIRKLGPVFFQFYGQAEAPQSVCVLRKEDHDPDDLARLATCGRPAPGCTSPCSTTRVSRSRGASRARSACAGRWS